MMMSTFDSCVSCLKVCSVVYCNFTLLLRASPLRSGAGVSYSLYCWIVGVLSMNYCGCGLIVSCYMVFDGETFSV